ncbi:MAG: helix-turn-helix domain-containing protein [Treponema sp.]|jgi:transcriptional regulator with XRE-family HTH domain|nr:helix-turn-helix domain-containing protein [Treponema sp.]
MPRLKIILAKSIDADEQALKDVLRANIKKFRHRRNWSQFTLAAKIDISTNFLADIEAGNTWVSSQTLVKLAKAFEIEAFELLKPEKEGINAEQSPEIDGSEGFIDRFSQDLAVVLQDTVKKAVDHVKNQYKMG